jgi:hypothetical protein
LRRHAAGSGCAHELGRPIELAFGERRRWAMLRELDEIRGREQPLELAR